MAKQKADKIVTHNLFRPDFNWTFVFFKWLPALRSGDYTQASGSLRAFNTISKTFGHCCLGVGADVANFSWSNDTKQFDQRHAYSVCVDADAGYENKYAYSPAFATKVGLCDEIGNFQEVRTEDGEPYEFLSSLAMLNDDGYSFEEIADVIERHARAALIERYHPVKAIRRHIERRKARFKPLDGCN